MEIDFIKNTTEGVLSKLNVSFDLEVLHDDEINAVRFLIKTDEPNLLIGHKGTTLSALSHVIKRITDKKFRDNGERTYFILDVNDYQKKMIEELKNKAAMLAERARYFKSSVEMNPMPPYERMIIHSIFTDSEDIKTESQGEGEGRRVVLKYVA
ncbi:MAG: hypothetical protein BMS9Abin13_456 [Patescibacteria group bacterium]|nr:MAG: hypothetical protein BMS9Abin13_456 [Patescibacteria group bacterium]